MTSMSTSDDRLLASFRRNGKRRSSYRSALGGRAIGAQHVALQGSAQCSVHGQLCVDENGALGKCVHGICMKNVFIGGPGPFDL